MLVVHICGKLKTKIHLRGFVRMGVRIDCVFWLGLMS